MKIKIKVNKDGRVKRIKSDIPIDLARFSLECVAGRPRRYIIKRSIHSRLFARLSSAAARIGYVLKSTAAAFIVACHSNGTREDVPRHQKSEVKV